MWRNAQKNCRSHTFLSSVSSRLGQLDTFGQPIPLLPLEHKDCDVLEIGFGCGYSASRIQSFKPRSHTIIECCLPAKFMGIRTSGQKTLNIMLEHNGANTLSVRCQLGRTEFTLN